MSPEPLEVHLYYNLRQIEGKPYRSLVLDVDFCELAVLEMLRFLGAADIYHITCGKAVYWDVKNYLDQPMRKAPFCPVVNLSLDRDLGWREWYITAINFERDESRSVGTAGC